MANSSKPPVSKTDMEIVDLTKELLEMCENEPKNTIELRDVADALRYAVNMQKLIDAKDLHIEALEQSKEAWKYLAEERQRKYEILKRQRKEIRETIERLLAETEE